MFDARYDRCVVGSSVDVMNKGEVAVPCDYAVRFLEFCQSYGICGLMTDHTIDWHELIKDRPFQAGKVCNSFNSIFFSY
jgi:hypothetical protein